MTIEFLERRGVKKENVISSWITNSITFCKKYAGDIRTSEFVDEDLRRFICG
jgi:hypothetical protein